MEGVKDKFITIVVTAMVTSLVSVGGSAIFFYFRTNFAIEQLYQNDKTTKENIDQLQINDKRQDEILIRYIENQQYIREKVDKIDSKFDKFVESYYNRVPKQ